MEETQDRPWIEYPSLFANKPVWWFWRHSFCKLGIHLFDEVMSLGPGHIDAGMIALAESTTGHRVEALMTGDDEIDYLKECYLSCDACGVDVRPVGNGYYD